MSEPPFTESPPSASLSYNVRWMTGTFNSRAKVESLLGPQRAAGNISPHDYDAAMNFLPGFHRFYGLFLSSVALSTIYILRKPSWSQLRTLGLAGGTTFGSLALGNAWTIKSHYDFVRSLSNPGGFSRAVELIQKQSGLPLPASPVIVRKYKVEEDLHGNVDNSQEFVLSEPIAEPEPQPAQTQTSNTETRLSSRWDQIRATNAAANTPSSWDVLRQKHEKPRVQKPGILTDQITNKQADDRTTEQAKFDALLGKERDLGSQNTRE